MGSWELVYSITMKLLNRIWISGLEPILELEPIFLFWELCRMGINLLCWGSKILGIEGLWVLSKGYIEPLWEELRLYLLTIKWANYVRGMKPILWLWSGMLTRFNIWELSVCIRLRVLCMLRMEREASLNCRRNCLDLWCWEAMLMCLLLLLLGSSSIGTRNWFRILRIIVSSFSLRLLVNRIMFRLD